MYTSTAPQSLFPSLKESHGDIMDQFSMIVSIEIDLKGGRMCIILFSYRVFFMILAFVESLYESRPTEDYLLLHITKGLLY